MIEIKSPLIQELLAGRMHKDILRLLTDRFGPISLEISKALQSILDEARLEELLSWAARCPDLESFRSRLMS